MQLGADCTWRAHVDYVVDKARRRSYALGAVLNNRRVLTEARRIVLLVVLRPVVKYASTAWHPAAGHVQRIEAVQQRVLRRFVGLDCNVSDDILRLEFGCRSYASWMCQRVLKYVFKVARMDAARLPAVVARRAWPLVQHACTAPGAAYSGGRAPRGCGGHAGGALRCLR